MKSLTNSLKNYDWQSTNFWSLKQLSSVKLFRENSIGENIFFQTTVGCEHNIPLQLRKIRSNLETFR